MAVDGGDRVTHVIRINRLVRVQDVREQGLLGAGPGVADVRPDGNAVVLHPVTGGAEASEDLPSLVRIGGQVNCCLVALEHGSTFGRQARGQQGSGTFGDFRGPMIT